MNPPTADQFLDLVEGLVMGGGLPSEELPNSQGVPVKEGGDLPDGEVFLPHIRLKSVSEVAQVYLHVYFNNLNSTCQVFFYIFLYLPIPPGITWDVYSG